MLQYLNRVDHYVFEFVQSKLRSDVMDPIFLAFRDKHCWIPLYIFLIAWLFFNYGKSSWKVIAIALVTITISDQLNSSVIKDIFKRDRPCKEVYFKDQFTPLINCSGGYSFPSSHAANHMALAGLLLFACCGKMKRWSYLLIFWAILVGWSQIYIGVHFPGDVLAGWIEGFIIGYLLYLVLKYLLKWHLDFPAEL